MKQEFDMIKALYTLTYDLESQSGQCNMGRMFKKTLDKAANEGVAYFRQMERTEYYCLRSKSSKGSYIRDTWATIDSNQRLFNRLRKLCKEYYANLFDHILGDGIFENETNFGFSLSAENVGDMIADEFKESLLKEMNKRWKKLTPER